MSWHSSSGGSESTEEKSSHPPGCTWNCSSSWMCGESLSAEVSHSDSAAQAGPGPRGLEEHSCQIVIVLENTRSTVCKYSLVFLAQPELLGLFLCQAKWRWSLFSGFLHSASWSYSGVILGVRLNLSQGSVQTRKWDAKLLKCCVFCDGLFCVSPEGALRSFPKHSRTWAWAAAWGRVNKCRFINKGLQVTL